jgi:hypothetical protein
MHANRGPESGESSDLIPGLLPDLSPTTISSKRSGLDSAELTEISHTCLSDIEGIPGEL